MTDDEFHLELIERAKRARRELSDARKRRILAEAEVSIAREAIDCCQYLISLERVAQALRDRAEQAKPDCAPAGLS
jgi:hypothetical protein